MMPSKYFKVGTIMKRQTLACVMAVMVAGCDLASTSTSSSNQTLSQPHIVAQQHTAKSGGEKSPANNQSVPNASKKTVSENKTEQEKARITSFFIPDTLGVTVAYLEQSVGVAKRVRGNIREYAVDDCVLSVSTQDGNIASMAMDITPNCPINWTALTGQGATKNTQVHFNDIEQWVGQGTYQADCLERCGNAFDPSVYLFIPGYGANGNMGVQVSAVQATDPVIDATSAWADIIKKEKGDDYLYETKFNCDAGVFDEHARRLLANVAISRIMIGDIPAPSC